MDTAGWQRRVDDLEWLVERLTGQRDAAVNERERAIGLAERAIDRASAEMAALRAAVLADHDDWELRIDGLVTDPASRAELRLLLGGYASGVAGVGPLNGEGSPAGPGAF